MKCGFLTVSYSGQFYDGPALPVVEQIRKARALGFEALPSKRNGPWRRRSTCHRGPPGDQSRRRRRRHRDCAIESLSNFASRLMEERENNLAMMRLVIDLAADLDVDSSRSSPPGRSGQRRGRDRVLRALEKGNYYKSLYPSDLRAGGARSTDCASRRTTPRSMASGWRFRITRRCCGPATRTRWR